MKYLPLLVGAGALYYWFVIRKAPQALPSPIDVASRVVSEEERLLSMSQPG